MIPDPSTADTPVGEDGSGAGPTGNNNRLRSRSGHHCAACGAPLEEWTRDLWCWASETTIAYWPCLLRAGR